MGGIERAEVALVLQKGCLLHPTRKILPVGGFNAALECVVWR